MPRDKNSNGGGSAPSNPEDMARRRYHATRCGWTTNGRGCLLTGTRSPDTGGFTQQDGAVKSPKAFCAWHMSRLETDHGSGDSAEFCEWLTQYRTTFPPGVYGHNEFTRFMPETLWDAAIGNETLPKLDKPAPPENRPASEAARKRAFTEVLHKLGGLKA